MCGTWRPPRGTPQLQGCFCIGPFGECPIRSVCLLRPPLGWPSRPQGIPFREPGFGSPMNCAETVTNDAKGFVRLSNPPSVSSPMGDMGARWVEPRDKFCIELKGGHDNRPFLSSDFARCGRWPPPTGWPPPPQPAGHGPRLVPAFGGQAMRRCHPWRGRRGRPSGSTLRGDRPPAGLCDVHFAPGRPAVVIAGVPECSATTLPRSLFLFL